MKLAPVRRSIQIRCAGPHGRRCKGHNKWGCGRQVTVAYDRVTEGELFCLRLTVLGKVNTLQIFVAVGVAVLQKASRSVENCLEIDHCDKRNAPHECTRRNEEHTSHEEQRQTIELLPGYLQFLPFTTKL